MKLSLQAVVAACNESHIYLLNIPNKKAHIPEFVVNLRQIRNKCAPATRCTVAKQ